MTPKYRVFKGSESCQVDEEGRWALPDSWYYEPEGYGINNTLYSEAFDTEQEARDQVIAEIKSEAESTLIEPARAYTHEELGNIVMNLWWALANQCVGQPTTEEFLADVKEAIGRELPEGDDDCDYLALMSLDELAKLGEHLKAQIKTDL